MSRQDVRICCTWPSEPHHSLKLESSWGVNCRHTESGYVGLRSGSGIAPGMRGSVMCPYRPRALIAMIMALCQGVQLPQLVSLGISFVDGRVNQFTDARAMCAGACT